MMKLEFFVLALLHYICSIQAIAIIPQLSLVNATTNVNDSPSPSGLSVSGPSPIAGFVALRTFDQSESLNAFNLWKSALAGMFELTQRGWEFRLRATHWVMAFSGSDVSVVVTGQTAELGVIKIGYIIIALYNAVNAMFQLQPGFFKSVTNLVLQERQIGTVRISKDIPRVGDGAGDAPAGNSTLSSILSVPEVSEVDVKIVNATSIKHGGSNNSLVLTNSVIDRDDPKLKVEYEYQRAVPRQDLWTAVLDGMATAAQFDSEARCPSVTAVSCSGNLVFHLNDVSNQLFNYRIAVLTYRLMALISMGSRVYKELDVSVFYDGTKVAEGYVLYLGKSLQLGDGEAASSER